MQEIIDSRRGAGGGTWVHPDVAIKLAAWLSVDFEVAVCQLVREFLSGKITTEQSQAVAESVQHAVAAQQQQQPMEMALLSSEQKKHLADMFMQQQCQKIAAEAQKVQTEAQKSRFDVNLHILQQCEQTDMWRHDCNLKMAVIDNVKNSAILPNSVPLLGSSSPAAPATAQDVTAAQVYVTVADWLTLHYPRSSEYTKTTFTSRMGRIAAKKYKDVHGSDNSQTVAKHVNGGVRDVKAYHQVDDADILQQAFQECAH